MKKYILFHKQNKAYWVAFLVVMLSLCFQSCNKKIDLAPESYWTENTYFTTVNEANMALLGAYSGLENGSLYGGGNFPMGDNDESNYGTRAGDDGEFNRYGITTANSLLQPILTALYNGVQRTNMCVDRIPKMDKFTTGTASEKTILRRYYAEALALRAIYYFDLVRMFGDVPFTTHFATLADDNNLPRTSRDTIYDHIIADLDSAINYLPYQSTLQNYEVERISKNAALGIQARICLNAAGYSVRWNLNDDNSTCSMALRADSVTRVPALYQKAYTSCKRLVDLGYNKLNTTAGTSPLTGNWNISAYAQIFKNYLTDLYYPQESMFEIGFMYAAIGSNANGRIGTVKGFTINGSSKYKASNNYVKCNATYWMSFEQNDTRQQVAAIRDNIDANSYRFAGSLSGLGVAKWRRDWCIPGTQFDNNQTGINWVMLRYSDVLLMLAEAENYADGAAIGSEGYKAFKLVRERAFPSNIARADAYVDSVYTTGKSGVFNAIVNERAWELGFEGWRNADLIRWNLMAAKIAATRAEYVKIANGLGRYSTQPPKMFYRYTISKDSIEYSLTTAFATPPATDTDHKIGSSGWLVDINAAYKAGVVNIVDISQCNNIYMYANTFVHNRSEIFPIPATVVATTPAFKQCPAYKGW